MLPTPADPCPRYDPLTLELAGGDRVVVRDDWYSDRIRCDHPNCADGRALGLALLCTARERGRSKVAALVPAHLRDGLEAAGLWEEARIPGLYRGEEDCVVFGRALTPGRLQLADPVGVARVDALARCRRDSPATRFPVGPAERAAVADAQAIAKLLDDSFRQYPSPSGDPTYIASQIGDGVPFRIARSGRDVVACASADLIPRAETAELTDCATRPEQRGRGRMTALLAALLDDLRTLDYPTAFTLARAGSPGINLVFQKLGFVWRGRMVSSCRIGDGIEDMNVWSRWL